MVVRPGADESKKLNIGTRNEDFQDCVMCSSYFPLLRNFLFGNSQKVHLNREAPNYCTSFKFMGRDGNITRASFAHFSVSIRRGTKVNHCLRGLLNNVITFNASLSNALHYDRYSFLVCVPK